MRLRDQPAPDQDREYAVREEVLDRINGLPPMYMPELDDDPPGVGMSDGDDVRWPFEKPPPFGADDENRKEPA